MRALSIRQPWAWMILHAGKDIENRTWQTWYRGEVLIHASQGMTRDDYAAAMLFIAGMPCWRPLTRRVPAPDLLERGGIVGSVTIVDCVTESSSPWFTGDFGFVLVNPKPLPFRPCKGALKFFVPPEVKP